MRTYGFPQYSEISSNLAFDTYQSIFCVGTKSGALHLFSLKGYEQSEPRAHRSSVLFTQFCPNKGILLSVDSSNILKTWLLETTLQ